MSVEELYQELILDHCQNPRWNTVLANPDKCVELRNPLCGDQLKLAINVKDGKIDEIGFTGSGCSISQATASIMSELLKGKTLIEARDIARTYRRMMRGETKIEELEILGDAVALEGVKRFSARIKCALLAWDCIERIVSEEPRESVAPVG